MGGDAGLRTTFPACIQALEADPDLSLVLAGRQDLLQPLLADNVRLGDRLALVPARQEIAMSDSPAQVLRHKPDASMRRAIELLASGEVDAVVSAGNTGALMALSLVLLETFPGIKRPAICAPFPGNGHTYMLDLGANVDCTAQQLYQFAQMGVALVSVLKCVPSPSLALLNIGAEPGKGNQQVKTVAELLASDSRLNYQGFVEGDDLFANRVDLIVCDGFVGNIALKTCEGTARFIRSSIHARFARNPWSRLQGLLAAPVLRSLYRQLDPQNYNGASLLGLQGVVVKSHGNSTPASFARAIAVAAQQVRAGLLTAIGQGLAAMTSDENRF